LRVSLEQAQSGYCNRRDYLTFALDVAKGLRGANPWLETQFDTAAAQAEAMLTQASATHVP
jgi:hypothetical protein